MKVTLALVVAALCIGCGDGDKSPVRSPETPVVDAAERTVPDAPAGAPLQVPPADMRQPAVPFQPDMANAPVVADAAPAAIDSSRVSTTDSLSGDAALTPADLSTSPVVDAPSGAPVDARLEAVDVGGALPVPQPSDALPAGSDGPIVMIDAFSCGNAGESCASARCCVGNTCVTLPGLGGDYCAAGCTTGSDCVSGCCAPLANSTKSVCAPATACMCKRAGEEGCLTTADCCAGSSCVEETSGGQVTRTVCRDYCTADTQCYSGCCAVVANATYRVCAAASFCPVPAPPPAVPQTTGTYSVTVSREASNLYRTTSGPRVWIKTRLCFEFVYYDRAILVWNGRLASGNRITFSTGRSCDVDDVVGGG